MRGVSIKPTSSGTSNTEHRGGAPIQRLKSSHTASTPPWRGSQLCLVLQPVLFYAVFFFLHFLLYKRFEKKLYFDLVKKKCLFKSKEKAF
jgi:hypothetical protein